MRIIDFKESKCMHCYKCVRYCDVKAVMIKDGRAEVIEDKCVLCGHCLHVCPQSAKTMASDLDTVKYYIRQGHRVVASLAPAYMGFLQEGTIGQIHEAFRKLGFFDVRETAEGAAAVTGEYAKLLEDRSDAPPHRSRRLVGRPLQTASLACIGASFIRLFSASVVFPFDLASSIFPTVISVRIIAADSK